jgi:hypothetical protein
MNLIKDSSSSFRCWESNVKKCAFKETAPAIEIFEKSRLVAAISFIGINFFIDSLQLKMNSADNPLNGRQFGFPYSHSNFIGFQTPFSERAVGKHILLKSLKKMNLLLSYHLISAMTSSVFILRYRHGVLVEFPAK